VGRLGLEPRTHGLKVRCSTIELTPPSGTRALTCSSSSASPRSSRHFSCAGCRSFGTAQLSRRTALMPCSCSVAGQQESQDDYPASDRSLATFLAANDMPGHVDDVTTEGIRAFLSSSCYGAPRASRPCRLQPHSALGRRRSHTPLSACADADTKHIPGSRLSDGRDKHDISRLTYAVTSV
jgi:hypothetical protein